MEVIKVIKTEEKVDSLNFQPAGGENGVTTFREELAS